MNTGRLTGAERQLASNDSDGIFNFDNKENNLVDKNDTRTLTLRLARATLQANRSRDRIFSQDLFFDPAWDIMLMLFVASAENVMLPLGDVVAELPGSPTTITRYINLLEERGYLLCKRMHEGASPLYLQLTALAEEKVAEALSRDV